MRRLFCCAVLITTLNVTSAALPKEDTYGFTARQMEKAFKVSGLTSRRLHSVLTIEDEDDSTPSHMVVLSSSRSGWHVSVFHRVNGGFKLEWDSHKLPIQFSVSSPNNFAIEGVKDESVVMFSGCAPHQCGGDYHGFLLYSPVRKQAFFALLRQEESHDRKITFSNNALEPRNHDYKEVLQKAVDEVIRRTDIK